MKPRCNEAELEDHEAQAQTKKTETQSHILGFNLIWHHPSPAKRSQASHLTSLSLMVPNQLVGWASYMKDSWKA